MEKIDFFDAEHGENVKKLKQEFCRYTRKIKTYTGNNSPHRRCQLLVQRRHKEDYLVCGL